MPVHTGRSGAAAGPWDAPVPPQPLASGVWGPVAQVSRSDLRGPTRRRLLAVVAVRPLVHPPRHLSRTPGLPLRWNSPAGQGRGGLGGGGSVELPPPPPPLRGRRSPLSLPRAQGKSGFHLRGGGGGASIEPPKSAGGGSGKRAQLTGPLISYYDLWRRRRRRFFPPPDTYGK